MEREISKIVDYLLFLVYNLFNKKTIGDKIMKNERINSFIELLDLPRYIANVLFETWNDCVLFLNGFHKKNHLVIDDMLDFREYKISQSTILKEAFIESCKKQDLKSVFEKTFYQSFSENDIKLLKDSINSGRTSLGVLFDSFKQNPNKNILKYAL